MPNRLFFEQIEQRRRKGEQWAALECWCSMDLDMYRHGRLASERAYAAQWKRSREWVRKLMQWYRAENNLPPPPRGRQPDRPNQRDDPFAAHFLDRSVDRISDAFSPPWRNGGSN